ncbi:MAG: glutathione S-transferase family protein [Pseudomonadota bacterium]
MILVHHLRVGRGVFTVWLLEELGLAYELKVYDRLDTGRAPPALKDAHPLGKAPVIEMDIAGDRLTLAESGAIASILCDHHDTSHHLSPPRSSAAAHAKWTQWLHYPEGSGMLPLMFKLIISRAGDASPAMVEGFTQGELDLHLGYLEGILSAQDYICGPAFQAPDIGVTFMAQMATSLELIDAYPALKAYYTKNLARPAFQAAMEKTGG